jgi:hypothetical protein
MFHEMRCEHLFDNHRFGEESVMLGALGRLLSRDERRTELKGSQRAIQELDEYRCWLGATASPDSWESFLVYLHRCNDDYSSDQSSAELQRAFECFLAGFVRNAARESVVRKVFERRDEILPFTDKACAIMFHFAALLRDGQLQEALAPAGL